ncbi:MAG TPA: hypothetical protein VL049_04235 [Candidatus Dormibacteraeota bacterium]|nr:hypothetical protein [Candidatus Dormibacteraeota bacterium]
MSATAEACRHEVAGAGVNPVREAFYGDVMRHLRAIQVPYLVGGAYAFAVVTGIGTRTKDLDLFVRRIDCPRALAALAAFGYDTDVPHPHWLAKVHGGDDVIDIIFNSGNGLSPVDDEWLANGLPAQVLGVDVRLCPVEEMIWNKAFIMERERYDGADVAHLLRACAEQIDWPRLLRRFAADLPVLLSHLILFTYVYPGERHRLPPGLMEELLARVAANPSAADDRRLCRGSLLSRAQYLVDVTDWGYVDARCAPRCAMSAEEVAQWTAAAPDQPHAIADDNGAR